MQQTNIPISSLVDMYKRGELRLPEIQRHYVWRAPRVRDLLDSLYRGYPSGSILMWETDEPIPTRDSAIDQSQGAFAGRKLLLDGQQRLTSLTAVINGEPIVVRGRRRPVDILFNLEHPDGPPTEVVEVISDEETPFMDDDEQEIDESENEDESENGFLERLNKRTFVVAAKNIASQPNWVSVSEVFKNDDTTLLRAAGITDLNDPRYTKYSERLTKLRKIRDYNYVVHVLEREMSYEEVTEIFVRVNSLGAKLKSSDLALAQMTSRWPNLLAELEAFQEECEQTWFTLDLGTLVRSIVIHTTNQCLFKSVSTTPIEDLKRGWLEAQNGLRFAINFLRTRAGIEDESLLSSPFFILTISAVSEKFSGRLSEEDQALILKWLFVANARGRYGRGASESLLNEDLSTIYRSNLNSLIPSLERQFGRFSIEVGDIAGRGRGSSLFSLAYLALKELGATDWMTGLGLSLTLQGRQHVIQHHHIFPKSLLKNAGYETNEINEIANMAFIGGRTNIRISNKKPVDYLPLIVQDQGENSLERQLVPLESDLWEMGSYRDFLNYRRQRLVDEMNAFIAKKSRT
jgi:hypothetical protein